MPSALGERDADIAAREGLDAFVSRLLLRYFRAGRRALVTSPLHADADDVAILRQHWAVSRTVSDLCDYIATHRHEATAALEEHIRIDDALVRGRLDARRTLLERRISGYMSRVVYHEPQRSYATGPNHVLVWVVQQAYTLASRSVGEVSDVGTTYGEQARNALRVITAARRVESVSQAVTDLPAHLRPSEISVAQAARARRPIYQRAASAYRVLRDLEKREPNAIAEILSGTLLSTLETWRAFELALALAAAVALGRRLSVSPVLHSITPGQMGALIQVGPLAIYWQSRTAAYKEPEPDPLERISREVLAVYGVGTGEDRPDIVVANRDSGKVIALGEAKYSLGLGESWRGALRDAVDQMVRYSSGYTETPQACRELLERGIIAVWNLPPAAQLPRTSPGVPVLASGSDVLTSELDLWADRVVSAV